jgi:hypothetical protein
LNDALYPGSLDEEEESGFRLPQEDEKYQSYLQMAERKETLVYNHGSKDRLNQLVHEKLEHAVHNRKWTEAGDLQPDVDELTAHAKEARARVDQVMHILKESNFCLNMSENAKDWKSCAFGKIFTVHVDKSFISIGNPLKKEVKDDEERKKSLNKKW